MDYVNNYNSRLVLVNGYSIAIRESIYLISSLEEYVIRLRKDDAKEFCLKGLMRRVFHIRDCLIRMSEFIDIQLTEEWTDNIPANHQFELTTILHSFFITLSGGLDNLAWIIVKENVLNLKPIEITLFHSKMQEHLSHELLAMLIKHADWLNQIKSFRDPMVHRIPLYVLPFITTRDSNIHNCSPYYAINESDGRLPKLHEQIISDARGFFEIIQAGIL